LLKLSDFFKSGAISPYYNTKLRKEEEEEKEKEREL
jgi:hypothetical protein